MIKDTLTQFANGLALPTTGTGIFNFGDVVDLGNIRDIGRGKPSPYLVILINAPVTSGGAATVQFSLVSDSQSPPRTDGVSENQHYLGGAIPVATLVAGYELIIPLPWESPAYARYLGIQANVGAFALTAGNASAFLAETPNGWKAFPAAVYA